MAQGAVQTTKNDKVKVNANDTADFLDQKIVSSDGSITITTSSCNCSLDLSATPGGITEQWIKATISYTDFNSAAATVDFTPTEFTNLDAGFMLVAWKIKHSTAWTGGTSSNTKLALGWGNLINSNLSVFSAPTNTYGQIGSPIPSGTVIPNHASDSSVKLRLTTTGDTCDNLTAGVADVWIKIAILT